MSPSRPEAWAGPDRTDGYVTGVSLPGYYVPALNPLHPRLALLRRGVAPSRVETACELGFGQGMSVALHAASSAVQWVGTDFNPEHLAFAQSLCDAAGVAPILAADSFADFDARRDLPDFDFIGLHGVWSWVSDDNRREIVDFVRRRLKPGGLLHVSYNTSPGWTTFEPVRHVLANYLERDAGDGGLLTRIERTMTFGARLLATQPDYVTDNPQVAKSFAKLGTDAPSYLAHEFFNQHWAPMPFATMSNWLARAGLRYVGSANHLDLIDTLSFDQTQRELLDEIDDPVLRETVRDFMRNMAFRRDYWMPAGPPPLADRDAVLREERVVLTAAHPELPFKTRALLVLNKAGRLEAAIGAVLAALADRKPRNVGEIERSVHGKATLDEILDALIVLAGYDVIATAQDDAAAALARKRTAALNALLLSRAALNTGTNYLASPVTGGGVFVSNLHQLFLLARNAGKRRPEEWAEVAAQALARRPVPAHATRSEREAATLSLDELTRRAHAFASAELTALLALQIADAP